MNKSGAWCRIIVDLAFMVLVGCAVVGCSGESRANFNAAGPYAAQFKQEYDLAESEYVKNILSDGQVDKSELKDAQQRMVQCMANGGYSLEFKSDSYGLEHESILTSHGTTQFTEVEMQAMKAVHGSCRRQWMGLVDTLYWNIQTNPNNTNWDDLVAECLVRHGLAAEGFTGEDYGELLSAQSDEVPSSGQIGSESSLPDGGSLYAPDAQKCQAVPLQ